MSDYSDQLDRLIEVTDDCFEVVYGNRITGGKCVDPLYDRRFQGHWTKRICPQASHPQLSCDGVLGRQRGVIQPGTRKHAGNNRIKWSRKIYAVKGGIGDYGADGRPHRSQRKIAALLELASGFDDDLSVRENAYLRGALLGYTREFMNRKYNDIIEFAELQNFQERRFKQLSSGMKSRLAFSIACLMEPDILVLDEVLSVGDGAFRRKSEDKMREILASGVTGILVSHSIDQIRSMSNCVLWLDRGRQICFSESVGEVCDAYEEFLITKKLPEGQNGISKMALEY